MHLEVMKCWNAFVGVDAASEAFEVSSGLSPLML